MKYVISRIETGHYECLYRNHLIVVVSVDASATPSNTRLWLWKLKDGSETYWAETKSKAIQSAINYINNQKQN